MWTNTFPVSYLCRSSPPPWTRRIASSSPRRITSSPWRITSSPWSTSPSSIVRVWLAQEAATTWSHGLCCWGRRWSGSKLLLVWLQYVYSSDLQLPPLSHSSPSSPLSLSLSSSPSSPSISNPANPPQADVVVVQTVPTQSETQVHPPPQQPQPTGKGY